MSLSPENKAMIASAIAEHKSWIDLLKSVQTGTISMSQAALKTTGNNKFPRAVQQNIIQIDVDFIMKYLTQHESSFLRLIRVLFGIPANRTFYISDETETRFAAHMKEALPADRFDVLCRHFGLFGRKQETLSEIAADYHLTRERIRQLENKAIETLRKPQHLMYLFPDEHQSYLTALQDLQDTQTVKDHYKKRIAAMQNQTVQAKAQIIAYQQYIQNPNLEIWKEIPLSDADFNVRATNVLTAHQCKSIYDVLQLTEAQILAMPNAGIGTLRNIQDCLGKLNLNLAKNQKGE